MTDTYCDRCDVFGHERYSDECRVYWSSVEAPYGKQMKALEGTIMKMGHIPSDMWPRGIADANISNMVELPPGTFVRMLRYTPWRPGMRAGNYFSIETLDGKFMGTQVHLGELAKLDALDRLSLLEEEQDAPG
jgi:hypothetical protein